MGNKVDKKNFNNKQKMRETFIRIMDDYKSGNPRKREMAIADTISNLDGFVTTVMTRYFHTYMKDHGDDLKQEGYVGIIKAMDNYDPLRSLPTTYFYVYIKHEMSAYVTSIVEKTTPHYTAKIKEIKKAKAKLEELKLEPTETAIAVEANLSTETVHQTLKIMNSANEVYLDGVPGDYIDAQFSDYNRSPEEVFLEDEKNTILSEAIKSLDQNEQLILKYSFYDELSYKEIAVKMGFSIEMARQIKQKALKKLRSKSSMKKSFRDYLKKDEYAVNRENIAVIPTENADVVMGVFDDDVDTDEGTPIINF